MITAGTLKLTILTEKGNTSSSQASAMISSDSRPAGSVNTGYSTPCGAESTGTDYFTFNCDLVTSATSIGLQTGSAKADLAEVVVAGLLWNDFPVQPGTESDSGTMSDAPTDCQASFYQDIEGMTFCRSAKCKFHRSTHHIVSTVEVVIYFYYILF